MSTIKSVLIIVESDKEIVRKLLDTNEANLKRDIEILKEWMKQQPHLPQDMPDDSFFESVLLRNKCRVEKSKDSIDSYFTLKCVWPEIYSGIKNVMPSTCIFSVLPLRNLTKDKERVIIALLRNPDPAVHDMREFINISMALSEILLRYDYCSGIRFVVDFTPCTLPLLTKMLPMLLYKFLTVIQNGYAVRIVSLEFYNPGIWLSYLMGLFKPILPTKIYNRIKIHNSLESLHKTVPKEMLPSDYGGGERSIEELIVEWDKAFKESQDLFHQVLQQKSIEELRTSGYKLNKEVFGVDGTFKKLDID